MGRINFARVLLGGFVTGVILNVGEWVLNGIILRDEMQDFFRKCGFPQPGTNFLIIAVVITFVLGIVMVLGYAALRLVWGLSLSECNRAWSGNCPSEDGCDCDWLGTT